MDTPHDSCDTPADFSFGTENGWNGLDTATMRVHTRARMIQSRQRTDRLRRRNEALEALLEEARTRRETEKAMSRPARIASLSPEQKDLSERSALIDLAERGKRTSPDAESFDAPRQTLRDLRANAAAKKAAKAAAMSSHDLDLRDRSALLDLRREHEISVREHQLATRKPMTILRDTQPRNATADRRWG